MPNHNHRSPGTLVQWSVRLAASVVVALPSLGAAQLAIPNERSIPVDFSRTVSAAKAKSGDPVLAKTLEDVVLADGTTLRKGALVIGHVVEARGFTFDETPYAVQQPSVLAVHFDTVRVGHQDVPLSVAVRAMANYLAVDEARTPPPSDLDFSGTLTQVGGDEVIPREIEVRSPGGDIVGYKRKQGIVAHLIPARYPSRGEWHQCGGTNTEEAVAIFSASACGLYGFAKLEMPDNGASSGTFRLESRRYTVKLYAGSAALLQVIEPSLARAVQP